METLFETYVLDGGPLMVVLLLCSIILIAIVIRDLIRFRPERVLPPPLVKESASWDPSTDPETMARRLRMDSSPFARVLARGLERRREMMAMPEQAVLLSDMAQDAASDVADDLYEDLGPLSTIYTVAPLLGLLGTIFGMMSAFREYARVDQRDLNVLSEGIQQALVTTLWGLAISILAYVAARYFESRIRRFEREVLPPRALEVLAAISVGSEATGGAKAPEPVAPDAMASEREGAAATSGERAAPAAERGNG
jgi:biopolymer transport protein ExbB